MIGVPGILRGQRGLLEKHHSLATGLSPKLRAQIVELQKEFGEAGLGVLERQSVPEDKKASHGSTETSPE